MIDVFLSFFIQVFPSRVLLLLFFIDDFFTVLISKVKTCCLCYLDESREGKWVFSLRHQGRELTRGRKGNPLHYSDNLGNEHRPRAMEASKRRKMQRQGVFTLLLLLALVLLALVRFAGPRRTRSACLLAANISHLPSRGFSFRLLGRDRGHFEALGPAAASGLRAWAQSN